MSASLGLYRLQQVDSRIDRARARLREIQKTLDNNAEMKAAQTGFDSANDAHLHAMHELRRSESEAQGLRIKIEQADSSLYGGNVRNPKELQDLQMEIASLKKHLNTLEEREIESMLASETKSEERDTAKANLEIVEARLGNEHKKLFDERAEIQKQLESLVEEREAALTPIETTLLSVYEGLRTQKRGVAVCEVDDGACGACATTINAALQQNARSQKLAYCPSCGRILFAN